MRSNPRIEPTDLLDADRLRRLLGELAERLARRGIEASVYLVGGAALALTYYEEGERRLTNDVDATFVPVDEVAEEAEDLAARHNLRPGWLNQRATQFLPAHGLAEGIVLIERAEVRILAGPPLLLLAMKLRAA